MKYLSEEIIYTPENGISKNIVVEDSKLLGFVWWFGFIAVILSYHLITMTVGYFIIELLKQEI